MSSALQWTTGLKSVSVPPRARPALGGVLRRVGQVATYATRAINRVSANVRLAPRARTGQPVVRGAVQHRLRLVLGGKSQSSVRARHCPLLRSRHSRARPSRRCSSAAPVRAGVFKSLLRVAIMREHPLYGISDQREILSAAHLPVDAEGGVSRDQREPVMDERRERTQRGCRAAGSVLSITRCPRGGNDVWRFV